MTCNASTTNNQKLVFSTLFTLICLHC